MAYVNREQEVVMPVTLLDLVADSGIIFLPIQPGIWNGLPGQVVAIGIIITLKTHGQVYY